MKDELINIVKKKNAVKLNDFFEEEREDNPLLPFRYVADRLCGPPVVVEVLSDWLLQEKVDIDSVVWLIEHSLKSMINPYFKLRFQLGIIDFVLLQSERNLENKLPIQKMIDSLLFSNNNIIIFKLANIAAKKGYLELFRRCLENLPLLDGDEHLKLRNSAIDYEQAEICQELFRRRLSFEEFDTLLPSSLITQENVQDIFNVALHSWVFPIMNQCYELFPKNITIKENVFFDLALYISAKKNKERLASSDDIINRETIISWLEKSDFFKLFFAFKSEKLRNKIISSVDSKLIAPEVAIKIHDSLNKLNLFNYKHLDSNQAGFIYTSPFILILALKRAFSRINKSTDTSTDTSKLITLPHEIHLKILQFLGNKTPLFIDNLYDNLCDHLVYIMTLSMTLRILDHRDNSPPTKISSGSFIVQRTNKLTDEPLKIIREYLFG